MAFVLSFVPALLGVLIVLQAGLNRKIAAQWGLAGATLLNATVLVAAAALFFAFALWRDQALSPAFRVQGDWKAFSLWFVLPGLIGFSLVLGGPWSIARWGAAHTFTFLISAQLAASLLWDWKVEQLPISRERLIGVFLAWAGVLLATRGR
ncbi:MAG: DMT family transporter [Oligoflexia bacterium]|nr:DMT family transporter [Oligoflexia bacterium]